jgi:hypothetical protein
LYRGVCIQYSVVGEVGELLALLLVAFPPLFRKGGAPGQARDASFPRAQKRDLGHQIQSQKSKRAIRVWIALAVFEGDWHGSAFVEPRDLWQRGRGLRLTLTVFDSRDELRADYLKEAIALASSS